MTDFMSLALAPFHDAFNGNSEQRVAFAVSGTNEDFRIKGDTWWGTSVVKLMLPGDFLSRFSPL